MTHSTDVKQAVVGLLTAMLVIDGKTDDAELARLVGHVLKHPLFAGLTEDDIAALSRSAATEARKHGAFPTLARWAVAVPPELAETVFELILQAMLADGQIHDLEGELGEGLREALKLSKERALAIADRVVKEQRGGAA